MSLETMRGITTEYGSGYRARLADIPNREEATHAWRCGWEVPTPERLEAARQRCLIDEGLEDRFPGTWGILFDVGGDARMNGIGFDEGRTKPWQ